MGVGGYRAFLSGVRAKDPEFRARWEQAINGVLPPDNDPKLLHNCSIFP